jgi:hypothetical protein
MGKPPLEAGGENATIARPSRGLAATFVGAPGTLAGVTLFEGADVGPIPAAFVAVTVKVYGVPLVSPVTVRGDVGPLAVMLPGDDLAVYDVMGEPPLDAGAVNVTVACAFPAVATPIVGAPGTPPGVTPRAAEEGPVPAALVAVTEQL